MRSLAPDALTPGGSWTWQNPLPDGNPLFAVSCPETSTCLAVGSNGKVLATGNGGTSWSAQNSGIATSLNGVSCPSTTVCVAAGDYGVLLRTTSGGSNWSAQTANSGYFFGGISCPTTSICYAVGYAGSIFKSANSGATWQAQVSHTPLSLYAISCSSAVFCAAVGQDGVITDTSDGSTWLVEAAAPRTLTAVSCAAGHCAAVGLVGTILEGPGWRSTGGTGTADDLFGVSCSDAWSCYAVGYAGAGFQLVWPPGAGYGYWEWDAPGLTSDLFNASCPSPATCVAVGAGGAIATTATSGTVWSAQSGGDGMVGGQQAISCPASISLCFAAGSGGTVGKSVDLGANWTVVRTGASGNVSAISCANVSVCTAVTERGEVVRTTDGGAVWTVQLTLAGKQLYGISCPTVTACFAVGWPGVVIATTNGGASWSAQAPWLANTPLPPFLLGISCASSTTCEAVLSGNSLGGIVGTTDGGANWVDQGSSVPEPLNSVSCPTTLICYAAGNHSKILKTTDGGTLWFPLAFASTASATGISCSSATVCAAVGPYGGPGLSTTDGTNWNVAAMGGAVSINCPTSNCVTTSGVDFISGAWTTVSGALADISCPTTQACMAVGTHGIVIITGNGGTTWNTRPAGTFETLMGVTCPTGSTCVAVGNSGVLLATVNSGVTWTTRAAPSGAGLNAVSCGSPTACVAVGASSTIEYTTDGGSTWAEPTASPTDSFHGVSCPTVSVCFAAGDTGVYGSIDGGASWTHEVPTSYFASVSCSSATTCIAVGAGGDILATGDGGASWGARDSGTNFSLLDVSCPTTTACLVSGTGALLLRSTDGGNSWSRQSTGGHSFSGVSCATATDCRGAGGVVGVWATNVGGVGGWTPRRPSGNTNILQGISCPGVTTCYAVGYPGTFLVTTDGTSWVDHSVNSDDELLAVSCPSVTNCYAVGWPGVIYVTSNSGTSWSLQTNPVSGTNVALLGISCAGPNLCAAVGSGGTALTTSNGTTWQLESSHTAQDLFAVSCPGTTWGCVAVGNSGVALMRRGGTWVAGSSHTTAPLLGVDCPTVSICYASGIGGTVIKTGNGGASWARLVTGITAGLIAIRCLRTTLCLASGFGGAAILTQDGSHLVNRSFATANALWSVAFPDAAHAWMVGAGGTILFNPNIVDLCASAPMSSDLPSPQPVGASILFTASSTGCSAPVYEYWLQYPSGTWVLKRAFSSVSTWSWNTTGYPLGTYTIHVWANQSGRSTATWEAYGTQTFTLTGCSSASIVPPTATRQVGTVVSLTASSGGGCPNPQYEFWIQYPNGTWYLKRGWDGTTFDWNTVGLKPGTYTVHVWANQIGGSTSTWQAYGTSTITLTSGACTSATLTHTAPVGSVITFTAVGSGCPNPQYEFWIQYPNGTWYLKRGWGGGTFDWNFAGAPPGTYNVHAWANNIGDSTATWQAVGSDSLTLP